MNAEVISASMDGKLAEAALLLGAKIPVELLENLSTLNYNREQLETDQNYMPWSARAIILANENIMVGIVRFHSTPDPEYLRMYARGAVELGYRIFSNYRRMGYAKETVKAVLAWAGVNFNITSFVASVSPSNVPSFSLINSLGFIKVDEVMDETDGLEHVFMLNSNFITKQLH
ncbi:Protein N-acetyltransferase, RimJ/RimL family [Mucilaginibacter sp. OK098]|nr:Protein N-acetyltransferase, RimJ/RimL family [Mucilaginibacter sp. OK098]